MLAAGTPDPAALFNYHGCTLIQELLAFEPEHRAAIAEGLVQSTGGGQNGAKRTIKRDARKMVKGKKEKKEEQEEGEEEEKDDGLTFLLVVARGTAWCDGVP